MFQIRQYEFGGPEVLRHEEASDLVAGSGQVRIAVEAAGVHLLDTSIRAGMDGGPFPVPGLPMVPGREVAGVVDAVGPGVEAEWLGRRVVVHLGMASGGYASQAVADVEQVIEIGDHVDAAEAVAMVGTGRTALAVLEVAELSADDVVLVTAAAGGIGSLLVDAARRAGCFVVGAAGSEAKAQLAKERGADVAIDYTDAAWTDRVRAELGDRRVTVGFESVGGDVGRAAFELVAPGGRIVLYGFSSGEPFPLSGGDLFASGVTVTAAVGARMQSKPGGIRAYAIEAIRRLEAGEWTPAVHWPFPLAEAAEAHRALEARETTGKVVLAP